MTSVPVPTFVQQDAWYRLTHGQTNPSIADSVPNESYLQPDGDTDGLVGSLDGGMIFLAGAEEQLDGGQQWMMWSADSLAEDDGEEVFCPFVDTSTPGRWLRALATIEGVARRPVDAQAITAGGTKTVAPANAYIINVFITGRSVAGATTLNLPGTTFLNQEVRVKDTNGDAFTSNIIVTAADIDGSTTSTIADNYGGRTFVWNSQGWSAQ